MLLGLADILFAYAYDHRTTTGDPSVESAWTVAVLSPLLSWLEVSGLVSENGSGRSSRGNSHFARFCFVFILFCGTLTFCFISDINDCPATSW